MRFMAFFALIVACALPSTLSARECPLADPSAPFCQEDSLFLGVNVNRKPAELEDRLLTRSKTHWVRANVDILAYKDQLDSGKSDPKWEFSDWKHYTDWAEGPDHKAILNLMWDFDQAKLPIPHPGSPEEKALFAYLDAEILTPLIPFTDVLVTGNEPFPNTRKADWTVKGGATPALAQFYIRVTDHVHEYLLRTGHRSRVALFVGAFTRLHTKKMQREPAVQALLQYAAQSPHVDGIDLHTHVRDLSDIDTALSFARSYTRKPLIVTEFTFVWRMKQALRNDQLGKDFAQKWGYSPQMHSLDYLSCQVYAQGTNCSGKSPVSKVEWDNFLASRDWYIDHFILRAAEIFRVHDVHGATFGLAQGRVGKLSSDDTPWHLGSLFSGTSVAPRADGSPEANYQYLEDFISLQP